MSKKSSGKSQTPGKAPAPGKDEICYSMMKQLNKGSLGKLLLLYNKIWEESNMPESWKESIIIPIKKQVRMIANREIIDSIDVTCVQNNGAYDK